MALLTTRNPAADGGYPRDSDLHQMTDDGGPPAPDPARWADPRWADGRTGRGALDGWTPVDVRMPPEGLLVDTLTADGGRARVKWEGRLWKLAGGRQCPCLAPEYWRPTPPTR